MERITISYHPDSERQVLQIADALKGFGFDTWIIEKNSNEDTFKKLEEAMRETAVVIVCLTSKYERSQDCIVELAYAANLKKNPIPIYLEKCYRAGGEVAQIVANKRYIDFSDDAEFWENTKMLKIEIENRLKDEGVASNPENLYMPVEDHGATGTAQSYSSIGSMYGGVIVSGGNINKQVIYIGSQSENGSCPIFPQNLLSGPMSEFKAKCIKLFEKHSIHTIDDSGKIVLKEVKIDEFAVKLKISRYLPHLDTFKDEAMQYFESLTNSSGDAIELSQLIDNSNRATFIRGIAGMGKTVFAKQLVYKWAKGEMGEINKDIKLCIMIECREINDFVVTAGVDLKKHEQFTGFLKENCDFNLGDGEGVLFVLDGLDELCDIDSRNSIFAHLFNRRVFPMSKVIITGRPHVENKMDKYINIGGLQKVEIQGLSSEQIKEYVQKFHSSQGAEIDLNNAKDNSKRFFPIIHVPQFLNTFCCIAMLFKGEKICSTAELYSWTLYLLLKQHADKQREGEEQVSNVFSYFSTEIQSLGKVCYKLLDENKIIMHEEDIKSILIDSNNRNTFIESLFVNVSDNYDQKYQFTHLTLMEFLSAFHICSSNNKMDLVECCIQNSFIEAVYFACQLIGKFKCSRIIKELLENAGELEFVDDMAFLSNVLKFLAKSKLDKDAKFRRSLDVVLCFLNRYASDKEVMISNIELLHCNDLYSLVEDTKKLSYIKEHLVNVCQCNESDLAVAFKNLSIGWFYVNEFEAIKVVQYLGNVKWIIVFDLACSVSAARSEIDSGAGGGICKKVSIRNRELKDEKVKVQKSSSTLEMLTINKCKFSTENSFINAVEWGTSSCEQFLLRYLMIKDEWWLQLVKAIEEKKTKGNGYLQLKNLDIFKCNPITEKLKT